MKKNWLTIVHTFLHIVTLGGYRVGESPRKDWKYLFIVLVVLIVCSAGVGGYIYWKVDNGSLFVGNKMATGDTVRSIDKRKLVNIVRKYEDRQKEFELFKREQTSFVDPSL